MAQIRGMKSNYSWPPFCNQGYCNIAAGAARKEGLHAPILRAQIPRTEKSTATLEITYQSCLYVVFIFILYLTMYPTNALVRRP
jgi:hypothetical protein